MANEPTRGSAGTAHDLNNLLQVIMGSLELLKRRREVSLETVETALRATREAAILAQRLLASTRRSSEDAMRARPGETVLLVEDNADVRRWGASALESLGYEVLQAADGAAALALLESPAAPRIDLLFTDVVLSGGMSGRELAEALRSRRSGLPVLFTTGYPREGQLQEKVDLEKPYDLERLASAVRSVLDAPR